MYYNQVVHTVRTFYWRACFPPIITITSKAPLWRWWLCTQEMSPMSQWTIHLLCQQKDCLGGSRKWPVMLTFSTVFMLICWVRKSPKLCWRIIWMVPMSHSYIFAWLFWWMTDNERALELRVGKNKKMSMKWRELAEWSGGNYYLALAQTRLIFQNLVNANFIRIASNRNLSNKRFVKSFSK